MLLGIWIMTNKKADVAEPKTYKVVETTITGVDHGKWFEENIGSYRTLAEMVAATIKSTLTTEGISYVDIPFREKKKDSFIKKIENKNKLDNYPPEKNDRFSWHKSHYFNRIRC